jgi:hypothetical protein
MYCSVGLGQGVFVAVSPTDPDGPNATVFIPNLDNYPSDALGSHRGAVLCN